MSRDFTDVEILKVGECDGRATAQGVLQGAAISGKPFEQLAGYRRRPRSVSGYGFDRTTRDAWGLLQAGLSLREFIHEFKYQTLVLFKCCLLQPKVHRMFPVNCYPLLTRADAILRVSMRATVHDAVLPYISYTWSDTKTRGLRRSGSGQQREEHGYANITKNK